MPRKDHMPDCRPAGDSARRISIPSRSTATSPYSPRRSFCSGVPFRSSACTAAHVYESEFHRALFSDPQGGYAGRIHPDDLEQEAKNGVAGMRHVFLRRNPNMDVRPFELICEYRTLFWRIRDADRHYRQDSGLYEYEHDTTLCEDLRGEYQPQDASYL